MNKVLVVLGILLFGFYLFKQSQVKSGLTKIKVGDIEVKVMVRDTVEGRRQGLSGFNKLENDEGMLFVFPVANRYSFWMKEMKIDLDFVFIKDGKVVEIIEEIMAPKEDESPVTVKPKVSVDKVLEVNRGWVKRNKVKIGDKIIY